MSDVDPYPWLDAGQRAVHEWVQSSASTQQWTDEGDRNYDPNTFVLAVYNVRINDAARTIRMDVHNLGGGKFAVGGVWAEGLRASGINPDELSLHSYVDPIAQQALAARTAPAPVVAPAPVDVWDEPGGYENTTPYVPNPEWAHEDGEEQSDEDVPESWEERDT